MNQEQESRLWRNRNLLLTLVSFLVYILIFVSIIVDGILEPGRIGISDWVIVLIVPGALLVTAIWFNDALIRREDIATNQHAQDEAIQKYLDQMSDLVINYQLSKDRKGKDFREESTHKVAQASTLAVLLGVDGERKRRPLKLVHELGLIKKDNPILELRNAGFNGAELSELTLREVCLRCADLRGADLQGADLSGSDLSYADLRGANLTNADLRDANLSRANLLPYDEQEPARLSLHNLKDHALPSDYYLRSLARLQEKSLRGLSRRLTRRVQNRLLGRRKPVTFTNLTDTKLAGANLAGAILANADLRNIRGLSREQVERVIGNSETLLPKADDLGRPLTFPKTWSDGIEAQIKEFEVQEGRKMENMDSQMEKRHSE